MINRLMARGQRLSAEAFVDGCIDMLGCLNMTEDTRRELVTHAQRGGELRHGTDAERAEFTRKCGEMFQMLACDWRIPILLKLYRLQRRNKQWLQER